MSLYYTPCRFCQLAIDTDDYESIPAHVICVRKNDKDPVKSMADRPLHHNHYAKDEGCLDCGKKHVVSKRRKFKKGWAPYCIACEQLKNG